MTERPYPTKLFTRQQVGALTGIEDSTLNYWMREGVLRAAEGGEGRGSHRRFSYDQVNLAAILNELRAFGVGLPALKRLAGRFHQAIDFMAARGIDRSNLERVFDAYLIRKEIVQKGFYRWRVERPEQFPDVPRHQDETLPHWRYVHLDWEQAVAFWFGNRPPELVATPAELAAVATMTTPEDIEEWSSHHQYFSTVTHINWTEPSDTFSTDPDYFYRSPDGEWSLTPDAREAQRVISFVGIDISLLTLRVWGSAK